LLHKAQQRYKPDFSDCEQTPDMLQLTDEALLLNAQMPFSCSAQFGHVTAATSDRQGHYISTRLLCGKTMYIEAKCSY